jgi:hypothetical protein
METYLEVYVRLSLKCGIWVRYHGDPANLPSTTPRRTVSREYRKGPDWVNDRGE